MEFIITFFRDILDGPVYIVVTVICSILICACIGYLAEKRQLKKRKEEQYVDVSNPSVSATTSSFARSASSIEDHLPSQSVGNATGSTDKAPSSTVVQFSQPQVVTIPVPDQNLSTQNQAGISQTPIIATAPSVQPVVAVSNAVSPGANSATNSTAVPTSVNKQ